MTHTTGFRTQGAPQYILYPAKLALGFLVLSSCVWVGCGFCFRLPSAEKVLFLVNLISSRVLWLVVFRFSFSFFFSACPRLERYDFSYITKSLRFLLNPISSRVVLFVVFRSRFCFRLPSAGKVRFLSIFISSRLVLLVVFRFRFRFLSAGDG